MKRQASGTDRMTGAVTRIVAVSAAAAACWGWSTPSMAASDLTQAFKTCVSLYKQPLAADLMRTIFDPSVRASFADSHRGEVQDLSLEHQGRFATATARLKPGLEVAGVPVRSIYASTCMTECPLSLWGLELGMVDDRQKRALQSWVQEAPTTPSSHTDIKVQLSSGPDGETFLVCDVSG